MTTDTLAKLAAKAAHEAVSAIYFADSSDYLPALRTITRMLAPDLAAMLDTDEQLAWQTSDDRANGPDEITAQALPAAEPWGAQPFNAPVYPPDGTKSPFTVINLGLGKVQMGDSIHDHRLPALWFGTNGQGMGHEEVMNREAKPGETLAVVTFSNVEGLDVLLEAVQRIRRESFPQAAQQAAQATAGFAPQPIETAPVGEEVLLFATKHRKHWFMGDWGRYNRHNQPRITHWSPLPSAPAALPQPQPQSAQSKGNA